MEGIYFVLRSALLYCFFSRYYLSFSSILIDNRILRSTIRIYTNIDMTSSNVLVQNRMLLTVMYVPVIFLIGWDKTSKLIFAVSALVKNLDYGGEIRNFENSLFKTFAHSL